MSTNSRSRILLTSFAGRGKERLVGGPWGVKGVVPAMVIAAAAGMAAVAAEMENVGIEERVTGGDTIPRPAHTAIRGYTTDPIDDP